MAIINALIERSEAQLNHTLSRYFGLALGLLFLGQQDAAESPIELVNSLVNHKLSTSSRF